MRRLLLVTVLVLAATAAPARAADQYCTSTAYGSEPARAAPLRFGIDPELAGSVGVGQSQAKPLDWSQDLAALRALTPPGKEMVLRVNRLFWSDGEAGIRRFQAIVGQHDAAGFDSELQVRYHPPAGKEGDIAAWVAYVRHVVDVFGRDPHVVAMTITNEANLDLSQNTSDGAYQGVEDALIQGIVAAREEADRIGRPDLPFGFTFAYRWNPSSDAAFWKTLAAAPDAFRRALGFVGVDDYPGTFWPPLILPTSSPGHELVVALATVRHCYMPMARLGDAVPIWVTENGYQSGALGDDAGQATALEDMVRSAAAVAGTYGVTDYRWFNLRDNVTGSPGIFDTTGLLRDDYTRKPAFTRYRDLVAALGAAAPAAPAAVSAYRTSAARRRCARAAPRERLPDRRTEPRLDEPVERGRRLPDVHDAQVPVGLRAAVRQKPLGPVGGEVEGLADALVVVEPQVREVQLDACGHHGLLSRRP